jgi:hypothetical protein
MRDVIQQSCDMHGVRDTAQYRRRHAAAIARKSSTGQRIRVSESTEAIEARIDHGRWIVECPCGAGNAVDVAAKIALCFGCGTAHLNVRLPEQRTARAIERALLARPHVKTRNWQPDESVDDLMNENLRHGVMERT